MSAPNIVQVPPVAGVAISAPAAVSPAVQPTGLNAGVSANIEGSIGGAPVSTAEVPAVDPAPVVGEAAAAAPEAAKPPKVKLTGKAKLADEIAKAEARIIKDTAFVTEAKARLESADLFDSIGPNTYVEIKIGRAETSRNVVGIVTGVDVEKERYRVYYGEGFDAETVVVQKAQIIRVIPAATAA